MVHPFNMELRTRYLGQQGFFLIIICDYADGHPPIFAKKTYKAKFVAINLYYYVKNDHQHPECPCPNWTL